MIMIAGHVHLDPADVDEFMVDAQATYPVAAANPGNVLLSFAVDNAEKGTVTVLEEWKSTDALAAHLATHQVQQIFAKWTARMRNEVRMFDATNERDPRA
jgi:quinol monooxygenase YgiN